MALYGDKTGFLGRGVFCEDIGDVVLHDKTAGVLGVVPLEVDSGLKHAQPIFRDVVVCLDGVAKMDGMLFTDIFDAKVIDNESKHDGPPLVAP